MGGTGLCVSVPKGVVCPPVLCSLPVGPRVRESKCPYASLAEYRSEGRADGPMKCTWFPGTTEKSPHEHYRKCVLGERAQFLQV